MHGSKLFSLAAVCSALGQCAAYTTSSAAASPTVALNYAQYEGTRYAAGVDAFLGMRFAAPPLGDLRFRAPQDPLVEADTQEAKQVSMIGGRNFFSSIPSDMPAMIRPCGLTNNLLLVWPGVPRDGPEPVFLRGRGLPLCQCLQAFECHR